MSELNARRRCKIKRVRDGLVARELLDHRDHSPLAVRPVREDDAKRPAGLNHSVHLRVSGKDLLRELDSGICDEILNNHRPPIRSPEDVVGDRAFRNIGEIRSPRAVDVKLSWCPHRIRTDNPVECRREDRRDRCHHLSGNRSDCHRRIHTDRVGVLATTPRGEADRDQHRQRADEFDDLHSSSPPSRGDAERS
jgi:hypothetical protein